MQNSNTYKLNPSNWMLAIFTILLLLKSVSVSAQVGNEALAMNEIAVDKKEDNRTDLVKNISLEETEIKQDKKSKIDIKDKKPYARRKRWIRYDGYKMN